MIRLQLSDDEARRLEQVYGHATDVKFRDRLQIPMRRRVKRLIRGCYPRPENQNVSAGL
jgi:hypothetical protein